MEEAGREGAQQKLKEGDWQMLAFICHKREKARSTDVLFVINSQHSG